MLDLSEEILKSLRASPVILGYVPRSALQQALQQRSGGRLHLT